MPQCSSSSLRNRRRFRFLSTTASTLFIVFGLFAAPGDHTIEILGRTGDAGTGPDFNPLTEIIYAKFGGGTHPVGIDDFGFVTFSAEVDVGGITRSGIYQYKLGSTPEILAQSATAAPGVSKNGEAVDMLSVPWRGYTSSPNGLRHSFSTYVSTGTETFTYLIDEGSINSSPLTYPDNLSNIYSPDGIVTVSDGRGTSKELVLGASDSLYLGNDGTLVWEAGHIFRGKTANTLTAVVFQNSPAPGFDESENAMFGTVFDLRGMDASNQVYFMARVSGASFSNQTALYRLASDSSELTLLFAASEHSLPDLPTSLTPQFEADDIFPLDDGSVILRAGTSGSVTGFWKISPGGIIDLAALLTETPGVSTDQGEVEFRSVRVDFADFAASDDGAIFFTGDVQFGVNGTNQEGVWMIDPEDNSIRTLARAPLDGKFGDAPGTDETYFSFSHLTADGEGHVAFMSELSNGKQGLFATDLNGTIIAIAIEGDELDGSTIETIHFTEDHAGAELSDNQGVAGMNDHGDIVFTAELANGATVIVKSSHEREVLPIGTTYIWNRGAGTDDWHDIVDGRSNWTDAFGTPWDKAPGTNGNETIEIESGYDVKLNQNVSIKQLTLGTSNLYISADMVFENSIEAAIDSQFVLKSGSVTSESGYINTSGAILKQDAGSSRVEVDDFDMSNATLKIEGGNLTISNTISNFEYVLVEVENGMLTIDDNVTAFKGATLFQAKSSGTIDIRSFGLSLNPDTIIQALSSNAFIKLGKGIDDPEANIELGAGSGDRLIHFLGSGSLELRQAIELGEEDEVISNHSGPEGTGFILNIHGAEYLDVNKSFINNGNLIIRRGGISGGPSSNGKIINNKLITILDQENDAFATLACENNGTIDQYGNVEYFYDLINKSGSKYNMHGATLRVVEGLAAEYLIFKFYTKLSAVEGINKIVTYDQSGIFINAEPTYNATIEVQANASLELTNARIGYDPGYEYEINLLDETSELSLSNIDYEALKIVGKGKAKFNSLIRCFNPRAKYVDLRVACQFVEFDKAILDSLEEVEDANVALRNSTIDQIVTFKQTSIRTEFEMDEKTKVTFEDGNVLSNVLSTRGTLYINSNIESEPLNDILPKIVIGDPIYEEFGIGFVEIGPNLEQQVVIEPNVNLSRKSRFSVGENSSAVLVNTSDVFANNVLLRGIWKTNSNASITLANGEWPTANALSEISAIGKDADLYLTSPPSGKSSINSFPTRDSQLTVNGNLTLNNHDLTFTSGSLKNRNRITLLGTSKIIGDVESVRDDVQGTPLLAGNFNIEGNVTSDGIISMGASPGSGLIDGDLTLLPGSEVIVEFAGTEPGTEFDELEVTGTANLKGKLSLHLIDDYEPDDSENFEFIKTGFIIGGFEEIDQSHMGRNHRFQIASTANGMGATAELISISSYDDWRTYFFAAEDVADDSISGLEADPDQDGLSNLGEYLFAGLPLQSAKLPFTFELMDTTSTVASLRWAKNVSDYNWEIQSSEDLATWTTLDPTVSTVEDGLESTLYEIDFANDAPTGDRVFYRFASKAVEE